MFRGYIKVKLGVGIRIRVNIRACLVAKIRMELAFKIPKNFTFVVWLHEIRIRFENK